MFTDKRYQEILGVILILISVMLLLSVFSFNINDYNQLINNRSVNNFIGPVGTVLSHGLRSVFGLSSYLIFMLFGIAGWSIIRKGSIIDVVEKISSILFFIITLSALISLFNHNEVQVSGGYIGLHITIFFRAIFGVIGLYLIVFILNLIALILLGFVSLSTLFDSDRYRKLNLLNKIKFLFNKFVTKHESIDFPKNSIEDVILNKDKKKKMPWIEKKKIKIPSSENSEEKTKAVKYLEMSLPLIVKGDDYLPENYSLINKERSNDDDFVNSIYIPENDSLNFNKEIIYENNISENSDKLIFNKKLIDAEEIENYESEESDVDDIAIDINKEYITSGAEDISDNPDDFYDNDDNEFESSDTIKSGSYEKGSNDKQKVFNEIVINKEYIIPTTFLNSSVPVDSESWKNDIKKNSMLLVNTLAEFGIQSKVVNVNRGPVITLYEVQIAPGIKVNRIVSLADDIAMALAVFRVRIVAPIPGKSAIGVEIPNKERESVTLGDIIKSKEYQSHSGSLKVALGKDILGKPVMIDLKKLPHLLIAGATGSGKSVCVNSIIVSLIYNYNPNYVRFILVDPKMVELQLYNGLPHLLTPVITEPFVAPNALKWAIYEMERRYRLLSDENTRDIERYNEKVAVKKGEKLPYIVLIIDELADLMMVALKEIEGHITRIAQKARAVGIHLVLATQRPSVDIITGVIKANFPARIAFQVAQKTDSRTIIDQNGAEKLLGKGDMLYQSPVTSFPIRVQGSFISEDEVLKVVEHLSKIGEPNYIDIEQVIIEAEEDREIEESDDELFVEAIKIVEETRKASASYLQRRLSIGYNRAARIIELMEERGYIGPQQGSKPREIFI